MHPDRINRIDRIDKKTVSHRVHSGHREGVVRSTFCAAELTMREIKMECWNAGTME
jgi:hypothetical protein